MATNKAITLHQFPKANEGVSLSPFCIKVESFLILNGLNYQNEFTPNPSSAPYKKFPFIEDSNGQLVPDSRLILKHLTKSRSLSLDDHLNQGQLALGHLAVRSLEEGTYWILYYNRWQPKAAWSQVKKAAFADMPALLRSILPDLIRRDVIKTHWRQGVSRLSKEQRQSLLQQDLTSLAITLDQKPFFLGPQVSSFDCSIHAFLKSMMIKSIEADTSELVLEHSNLADYVERFDQLLAERQNDS